MGEELGETPPQGGGADASPGPANSVIRFLEAKTGEAPRVNLRDEDSASVSAPVIDPSSQEKLSVPHGRGNYQLMGEIARGGMGVVLKGHDTDLGRDIAVKVLDKRLCDRMDVVQRFVEEAQIGGQLQHPGVVPVYELGLMEDERPYFTMKLVKGRTLAALLAQRETPDSNRGTLLDVFESVCQTMAYAHSRGVIHRDLKPANIMVGAFGEVQVVDWGLAKVLVRGGTADEKRAREVHNNQTVLETVRSVGSGSGSESMVGSVLGTPAYMPPEQASGLVDRLDERADVFALGAILCEILTGLPPYVGEPDEVISAAAQAQCEPALGRLDACGADPELVELTKQCLLAAPAARPANAGVVAERMQRHIESVEERAQKAQVEAAAARVREAEERKARKLTLALGASILGLVVVGAGGWLWVQGERAAQQQAEAERRQVAAEREQALTEEVNLALTRAASLQGAERWDEALDAAARARALAEGGDAGAALLGRVVATEEELRGEKERADGRAARERDTRALLAELHDLERPGELQESTTTAAAYEDCFRAHGLDVTAGGVDDIAARLAERGIGSEVAVFLDTWGEALRAEGDESGALRLLELAHSVDPDPVRAHLREALLNRDVGELEYLAGTDLAEQPASTLALLASGLNTLGSRASALSVYRAGVLRHPDHFGLAFGLGKMLKPEFNVPVPVAEMEEALANYRVALALRPDSAPVLDGLFGLNTRLQRFDQALEYSRIQASLDPDDPELRFQLGRAYMLKRRFDAASELFEGLVDVREPAWLPVWSLNNLAVMSVESGDVQEGLWFARRSWKAAPSSWPLLYPGLLLVFAKASVALDSAEPISEARRLLDERYSEVPAAYNTLAWSLVEFLTSGDDPALLAEWGTASSLSPAPGSASARLLWGHAVELAERTVELDPGAVQGWNTLGVARLHSGDLEGAIEAFMESERIHGPGLIENWLHLAMAHHDLGNSADADSWFERADGWIETHPSDEYTQVLHQDVRSLLGAD